MALRFHTERIDASRITRTAAGLARVDATVAKAGVYPYTRADGRVVREYLPAEEIARADSLATLEDATVTNRHPGNMVDSTTWGAVSIGHARGARTDGTGRDATANATLVIARADAQASIGTDLVEVSRGVKVRVDETPGVTPWGEHYDAVQRDIVYNHVALGPRGWGRQGAAVSLRLDSAGDELIEDTQETPMKYTDPKTKIVHEFKTDGELAAYLDGRADAGNPFAKKGEEEEEEDPKEKKKAEKKDAELAAEKARADKAQAKLDAIEAEKVIASRAALTEKATKVLGPTWKADSAAKDRDIHTAVLAKLTPTVKYDTRTDAYVEAAFDHALEHVPASPGASRSDQMAAALHGVAPAGTGQRQDGAPTLAPREDMIDKNAKRATQPLSYSVK